ncbi:glycoside hydrolase [Podospora didyma]|uniref:Glycoside hydrolase n=1 Tax=Podospora didyma TaxID=330526 RepID=A0AAE0N8G3_9PEZI|nr:glycoside hydrolase [Podospora didyma]
MMNLFLALAVILLRASLAHTTAVFAHFMVSNTHSYTTADWNNDIQLAQAAHIDAFALNLTYNEGDDQSVAAVFNAASALGFKLFFSFDYAGNRPWPKQVVIDLINQYSSSSAYHRYQGRPFVSTFEGPERATDWIDTKGQTQCFFGPD